MAVRDADSGWNQLNGKNESVIARDLRLLGRALMDTSLRLTSIKFKRFNLGLQFSVSAKKWTVGLYDKSEEMNTKKTVYNAY